MRSSQTRKKLFFTCIIFMCIFVLFFIAALQMVTENAYIEAIVKAEIIEMQQIYDVYNSLSNYHEESFNFLTGNEYMMRNAAAALAGEQDLIVTEGSENFQRLTEEFSHYSQTMDIYIVDSNNILCMRQLENGKTGCHKSHNEGDNINFLNNNEILNFLKKYGYYTEDNMYMSNHALIKNINPEKNIVVIGIPRYDKIFDFTDNQIIIYNRFEQEQLRLNTESVEYDRSIYNFSSNKNYKKIGIGKNRLVLCYFSNEDELGNYCLGTIKDLDFSFRIYIYVFLVLFFTLTGVILWSWSEKVTKPLDFFIMWMKLIKDKASVGDSEVADQSLPKENHLLQNNIMLYFSFCLIPLIIAGATHWYAENQILNKYVEERYVESAQFYSEILDAKFYVWQNPISLLCNDEAIEDALIYHNTNEDVNYDIQLIKYISEYTNIMSDDADRVTIYNTDGTSIVSTVNDYVEDRYIKYRVNINEDYKWAFTEGISRLTLHQKIYSNAGEIIGYCKLELRNPELRYSLSYSGENIYSCYIYKYTDKVFNLIGSPYLDDEKIIKLIANNTDQKLAGSIDLKQAGINYFYVVKEKVFFDRVWNDHVVDFMNIIFFMGIAVFFAAGILTRATLNPVIHLSNALYNDSPQIPMSTLLLGKEEFALIVNRVRALSEQVDTYAKEQKQLEEERQEHEKRRKDAEILTLQTQINPHFMYNIFSSISVLIKTGQSEKAADMVMHTGNLMRLGLYRGHVMIPLKEEIDHVTQYIKIQQIRYNNCMEVKFNVEESFLQLKVVKFILQPIIENAIEHNVGYLEDRILIIQINVLEVGKNLIIEIQDNGRGLDDKEMDKLQESINNFDMSNHLGLANINERIKLNCGMEYGVVLDKNKKMGLRVELKLPIVVNKEEQRDV